MLDTKFAAAPALGLALSLALAIPAHAETQAADYGTVTEAGQGGRVIEVTPGTRYLNVSNGEVVTIRIGDASFIWQVSTPPNVGAIPLTRIAPAGVPATGAWIYVAAGPNYQNS